MLEKLWSTPGKKNRKSVFMQDKICYNCLLALQDNLVFSCSLETSYRVKRRKTSIRKYFKMLSQNVDLICYEYWQSDFGPSFLFQPAINSTKICYFITHRTGLITIRTRETLPRHERYRWDSKALCVLCVAKAPPRVSTAIPWRADQWHWGFRAAFLFSVEGQISTQTYQTSKSAFCRKQHTSRNMSKAPSTCLWPVGLKYQIAIYSWVD